MFFLRIFNTIKVLDCNWAYGCSWSQLWTESFEMSEAFEILCPVSLCFSGKFSDSHLKNKNFWYVKKLRNNRITGQSRSWSVGRKTNRITIGGLSFCPSFSLYNHIGLSYDWGYRACISLWDMGRISDYFLTWNTSWESTGSVIFQFLGVEILDFLR